MVLKSEEPGSKQKLAMEYGYSESICHDMINHLVNDIAVMGAKPLAVLDTIVCGKAEKETIKSFVKGISEACRENECNLLGGETSIQPDVVSSGLYILTSSIAGIVSKSNIIDGANIHESDIVLAIASNGLHTNLEQVKTLPIFSYIKSVGNIDESEMLSTFNCGIGMIVVVERQHAKRVEELIKNHYDCYEIGRIETGSKKVNFKRHINW